jgi:hypothetical protein
LVGELWLIAGVFKVVFERRALRDDFFFFGADEWAGERDVDDLGLGLWAAARFLAM